MKFTSCASRVFFYWILLRPNGRACRVEPKSGVIVDTGMNTVKAYYPHREYSPFQPKRLELKIAHLKGEFSRPGHSHKKTPKVVRTIISA